ncbi:phytoene desaturase [Mucilaginibacter yixingensis]|uniref:Phytoene desaturase n=1 Tax=Mucilaginibacter yixingensis TaxID=1295612 RepID=A0A2T5JCY7_9SPHI|nr:1-hydroxycarotenoid 3,4-desaturase CrtD [Mucilaginibacter yixingensis]PTQ99629.1 phytoene desaturase [Mucilaginibacter yixingensis]
MAQKSAVVIGAGVAGIAVAIRLAVKGYAVHVFEANNYPGGKLSEFTKDGFRFDAGPSLFTMPQYVDELFRLAGKNPQDYFSYQKLDTVCHYFYPDGTRIKSTSDADLLAAEIQTQTGEPAGHVSQYLQNSKRIYGITNHVFLEQSLHRLRTYLSFKTLKSVLQLFQIDAMRTMHRANQSFFRDKRLVQYFDRYATYNGSNPYQAPATLNVIPHLEQHLGAYFPEGGMYSITQKLVELATSLSVKINYNAPVEEILLRDNRATGIKVNGEVIEANIVVSNMDVYPTYKKLLGKRPDLHPQKTLRQERSSSALIFYWGILSRFDDLHLHNIFFSGDYKAEFNAIWKEQTISNDPTVYINISSKLQPGDAPDGCENWFVMINVPANNGQDWDALVNTSRRNVIKKLSSMLGTDIAPLIVSESVLDPRNIEQRTSSYKGSIYGSSSNSQLAAFLRHANRQSKVKNLYFCGGSVHPGGGIPLALLSAKIVADWV